MLLDTGGTYTQAIGSYPTPTCSNTDASNRASAAVLEGCRGTDTHDVSPSSTETSQELAWLDPAPGSPLQRCPQETQVLSSVQHLHKSNQSKSLSHSPWEIRALINLRAAFQKKLRVTINPFAAQVLLPSSTVGAAGKGGRRALLHQHSRWGQMSKAEGCQDQMTPCRYEMGSGQNTTLAPC